MSNQNEYRPETTEDAIMWLIVEYTDAYRAGHHPNAAHYIAAYPDLAEELLAFFVYYHCVAADLPDPDPYPTQPMPDAAKRALAQFRREQTSALN